MNSGLVIYLKLFLMSIFGTMVSCDSAKMDDNVAESQVEGAEEMLIVTQDSQAVVLEINVSGSPDDYTFAVALQSPDTGCDQYADWWEVLSIDGALLYRRILGHSHINEQPFTRSGGPVEISENEIVIIRGHMNPFGYGSLIMKGSVLSGFVKDTISTSFAEELNVRDPLPENCAF